MGGRCWLQVAGTNSNVVYTVAVPGLLNNVSCCTRSGPGISVESPTNQFPIDRSSLSILIFPWKHASFIIEALVMFTLAWCAIEPRPPLACTASFEGQT